MSGGVVMKCKYFNSGYCRYTKKEMGCKNFHPTDVCEVEGCREKECPDRHPKNANLKMNVGIPAVYINMSRKLFTPKSKKIYRKKLMF